MEVSARKAGRSRRRRWRLAASSTGFGRAATYWHAMLADLGACADRRLDRRLAHEPAARNHPRPSDPQSKRVNTLIGTWPLALWVPYEIYRRTHLQHHNDSRLTDPLDDPESYYWTEEQWRALGRARARAGRARNATFLGRVTIGPAWVAVRFWRGLIRQWLLARSRNGRDPAAPRARGRRRARLGDRRLPDAVLDLPAVLRLSRHGAGAGALLRRASRGGAGRASAPRSSRIRGFSACCSCSTTCMWRIICGRRSPGIGCRSSTGSIARRFLERNGGLLYNSYFDVWRRYWLLAARPAAASRSAETGGLTR